MRCEEAQRDQILECGFNRENRRKNENFSRPDAMALNFSDSLGTHILVPSLLWLYLRVIYDKKKHKYNI